MVYERDKFLPKVSEKSLTIPFNEEIMGFIQIQENVEQNVSFFSSISRKKFNESIINMNYGL